MSTAVANWNDLGRHWLPAAVLAANADPSNSDVMEIPGRLDNDEVLGLADIDLAGC